MSDILNLIKERTSVRCFKNEAVKEEDVKAIAEAAIWAPNAMNKQGWHFSVVKSPELIEKMSQGAKKGMLESPVEFLQKKAAADDFHAFFHAPLVVVITREEEKFTFFDCGAAAENICLAAKGLGYDSCITASTEFMFMGDPELYKVLEVPEGYKFTCAIPIGIKQDAPDDHVRARNTEAISYL